MIQKFLLDNGWKGYQSWEKRWFLTEMGLKQDYSTCVWNNKPLSKDDNHSAPLQANKPRFARSLSSIPQNVQGPLARMEVIILKRAIRSSLGRQTDGEPVSLPDPVLSLLIMHISWHTMGLCALSVDNAHLLNSLPGPVLSVWITLLIHHRALCSHCGQCASSDRPPGPVLSLWITHTSQQPAGPCALSMDNPRLPTARRTLCSLRG